MSLSHNELIDRFEEGYISGSASNMFISGDVLYSYGRHFPLLLRMPWGFLLNADKYSATTTQHQSQCFSFATVQVCFSALTPALGNVGVYSIMERLKLVASDNERWDYTGYYELIPPFNPDLENRISRKEYQALPSVERICYKAERERRPGACVLRWDDRFLLSSMEGWNYFICELPYAVTTIEEAFSSLKPPQIKDGMQEDVDYHRQGEWFFIPATRQQASDKIVGESCAMLTRPKQLRNLMSKRFKLPRKYDQGNVHWADRGINGRGGSILVTGRIHHPEHRMLKLSKAEDDMFFWAYENTALASWSASGNVD